MSLHVSLFFALLCGIPAMAQLQPQDAGSSVQFRIKNLGFNVTGLLTGLEGAIRFDVAHPGDAAVDVSVSAASINTDNGMRDDHLRGESFFDVKRYPRIRLVSTGITAHRKGAFLFTGQLTIKEHVKEITFPFTVTQTAEGSGGLRFQGSFTINRRDFDIGGFSTIADQLEVTLDVLVK